MRILIVISLISLLDICVSDKHKYGHRDVKSDSKLHETVLIESNSNETKSYFIHFKYFVTHDETVNYVEFDINSPSTGSVEGKTEIIKDKKDYYSLSTRHVVNFVAKIHINATSNCKATLKMYKKKLRFISSVIRNDKLITGGSLTIIYVKNVSPVQKAFAHSSIGKRQNGDKLIHFQSRNVTNIGRFPSRYLEYAGKDYITYVGFSFNSPTAMAMVNTTFINEREFNTIVYDMNTEHFVANISVYGIKSTEEPPKKRKGVMSLLYRLTKKDKFN